MAYQDWFTTGVQAAKSAIPTSSGPVETGFQKKQPFSFDPLESSWFKQDPYSAGAGLARSSERTALGGITGASGATTSYDPFKFDSFNATDSDGFSDQSSSFASSFDGFGSQSSSNPFEALSRMAQGATPSGFGNPFTKLATSYSRGQSVTGRTVNNFWDPQPPGAQPGAIGGGGGGGAPATYTPGFAQFTPGVENEINAAAAKYGVPANFLKVIIAKESSGDWARNSQPVAVRSRGGKLIHGYIGVFIDAAQSYGFNFHAATGNRAAQIDMLAGVLKGQYNRIRQSNPNYNWLNVASYHYSGNPNGGAAPADSVQHGSSTQYMNDVRNWWGQLEPGFNPNGSQTGNVGGGGVIGSGGPAWANVNRWDSYVTQAASKYGVPANLVKSIMRLESGGNPSVGSPQGATGLMQIMPFWNGTAGLSIHDPVQNIHLGTYILKQNYNKYGSWEMAARAYLGLGGADAYGTTHHTYWQRVQGFWNELNASSGQGYGGGGGSVPSGTSIGTSAIFGGRLPGQSQGFGVTSWSRANPRMYAYAEGVGMPGGHPGIDYSVPYGTKMYIPVSGRVIYGGGSGSFRNDGGDMPGRGELRIQTANGDLVILGHMSNIPWRPGQTVRAGDFAGLSGTAGSGAHLHLEVRRPGNTRTGWIAVDPDAYFRGQSIAYGGGGPTGAPTQGGGSMTGATGRPFWETMMGWT